LRIKTSAPPGTLSIAGRMISGAVRSPAARIVGIVLAGLVVVGAILGGISNGAGGVVGGAVVAVFLLFMLGVFLAFPAAIVVVFIAARRARSAESTAMQGYAGARRLTYSPAGTFPESTPLLSAGSSRKTEDVMTGLLPGGLQGTLAHHTYYVRHSGGQQGSYTVPYPYTVVLAQIPESTAFVRKLLCHDGRRIAGASIFGIDLSGEQRVELESTLLNERYRIATGAGQDQGWLRELFTPMFIDWLATQAAHEFSFELVDGLLCVSLAERLERADQLDWLCGAAVYVAGRIRGEVAEERGPATPG
jgi:hypothetical protein